MVITMNDSQLISIVEVKRFLKESKVIEFKKRFWKEAYEWPLYRLRGEVRAKVYLGFKISAINCKRLIKGLMNRPKIALPALLYHHLFSLFSFQRTYQVRFA